MKKLGERLIESGLLTSEGLEKALKHQRITGHKLGDCLVEIGAVEEGPLLRVLAAELNTRFVQSEKLAQVRIGTEVLDKVPVRMAEQQSVLPIAWDSDRKALSIVMAEPQNESLVKEVAAAAGAEEMHPFLALRGSIQAAIRKHYYGDPEAFAPKPGKKTAGLPAENSGDTMPSIRGTSTPRPEADPVRIGPPPAGTALSDIAAAHNASFSDKDYLETVAVLVGLLESQDEKRDGHSSLVARHATALARKLGFAPADVLWVAAAAYLHDLGKPPGRHYTLLAIEAQPQLKAEARNHVRAPIRLFESVHLPAQVNQILAQIYEAWDGSGVPHGARSDEIAPGARLLAVVDAYLDLRRSLSKRDALAAIRAAAGRLFDPQAASELLSLQSGQNARHRLESEGRVILVAEVDADIRTSLVDALLRGGAAAEGVSSLDGVREALIAGDADVLGVGWGFGAQNILATVKAIRSRAECAGAPIALLGDPGGPAARDQLLADGLTAIVANGGVETAARTLIDFALDRSRHGGPSRLVRGSFDELPMREVLTILARDRKSGRLAVHRAGAESWIQIENGRVVFAAAGGRSPEDAIREIAAAAQGEFAFDGNSVLLEPPNLDVELSIVLRALTPAA